MLAVPGGEGGVSEAAKRQDAQGLPSIRPRSRDSHWFGTLLADDVDQEQARRWQAEIAAKDGYSNESAMKVRTSVVAPGLQVGSDLDQEGPGADTNVVQSVEGLPMLETVVERQDRLESVDESMF